MKMRILSQLYGIAHGLKDSQGYIDVILEDFNKCPDIQKYTKGKKIDEAFLAERASYALEQLLHNYNFFHVETIDRFFQTVLRNLARELDLTPNLRVELSDKDIEYAAVDRWIDSLQKHDRELEWIIDYVHSSMDDDKSWNVIGKIKAFGENLFKDDYKKHSSAINEKLQDADQKFYTDYTKKLRKLYEDANNEIHELGAQLWDKVTQHGLDETSFAQSGRGIGVFLKKLTDKNISITELSPNSFVQKCYDLDDTEAANWTTKKAPQRVKDICRDILRPDFISLMHSFSVLLVQARSAKVTLSNMSQLRLLRAIQQEIEEDNKDQDRFLLSDTQTLLRHMIDNSDSPFIFEKIGSRLQNIMIDEFQDTSVIQWENFKVLLQDCMSQGYENLIVGDVKQSIYRWRSGDWRLLNNIEGEFGDKQTKTVPLKINRRSAVRVINFNNAFFKEATVSLYNKVSQECDINSAEMLKSAYADVEQQYPEGKKETGFASVELLDKGNYEEATLQRITDIIISLVEHGVQQKDIAILVRTNKSIPLIARYCMEQFRNFSYDDDTQDCDTTNRSEKEKAIRNLTIVSDEAYLLDASPAVNIIVDALRLIQKPTDELVRARLFINYQRYILNNPASQAELLEMLKSDTSSFLLSEVGRLRMLPLYQLCEELFTLFDLSEQKGQSAYVCYFFDCLTEHLQNSAGDIPTFLKYWDESMHKRKIESDSDNGIRILSIHKSKGLEFQTVIIPFCDWQLEKPGIMWCEPKKSPYNDLPIIPLNGSQKEMTNTIYEDDYKEEHLQNEVDNINLLYVGLTRAVDNLYIMTAKGQTDKNRGNLIENIMPKVSEALQMDAEGDTYTYGSLVVKENKNKEQTSNVFLQPSDLQTVTPQTTTRVPEFRESNRSKDFTLSDEQEEEQQKSQYIKLGNVLHSLFSTIRTVDDVDRALLRLEMDGLLYGQDITAEALREKIAKSMENPQVASWFAPGWRLYNECTILTYDADSNRYEEHRPDRVMTNGSETIVLDFKLFSLKDEYFDQVRCYMDLMQKMGYPNVKGYLWQVFSNKITEVKSPPQSNLYPLRLPRLPWESNPKGGVL